MTPLDYLVFHIEAVSKLLENRNEKDIIKLFGQEDLKQDFGVRFWLKLKNLEEKNHPDFLRKKKEVILQKLQSNTEKMFIAAFEKNIECLENRFNQNGLEYYEALLQVLILAASKKNYDTELKKISLF